MEVARSIMPQSPWASHVAQSRVHQARGERAKQLEQLLFAYAIDAKTGIELWRTKVDAHPNATITGTPSLLDDTLYVPVSPFLGGH